MPKLGENIIYLST